MKKILLLAGVLIFLLVAGVAAFVVTFDADRYRPLVQKEVETLLGQPVKIDKIVLGWRAGPALEVKGIAVENTDSRQKPVLTVESFGAQMDWAPLLQGRVEISSVFAEKPRLYVVRDRDGMIRLFENIGKNAESASSTPAAALSLLIESAVIENGEIIYRDETLPTAEDLVIHDLDIRLRNVSLAKNFPLEASAALFSSKQNLKLSGNIRYLSKEQAIELKDFVFDTDLKDFRREEILKTFAFLEESLAGAEWAGRIHAELEPLRLTEGQEPEALLRVDLSSGRYQAPALPAPVENIEARAEISNHSAVLEKFSGYLAGGKIAASGTMKFSKPEAETQFRLALQGFELTKLLPKPAAKEPKPEGLLSVNTDGRFFGQDLPRIQQTLSGQGQLDLENFVIRDLNVIRDLMKKLSIIPGLVQRLQEKLPPSYLDKMEERDTFFAPVQVPIILASGRVNFPQIQVVSDSFAITGNAQADLLKNTLAAPMMLLVEPELSTAFIRSVQELQALSDREGRLSIPFQAQGVMPDIRVLPDLQFITSRIAVAKTQEVLSGIFERKKPSEGSLPSETPEGQALNDRPQRPAQNTLSGQALLGQLLQNVLAGEAPAEQSAQ